MTPSSTSWAPWPRSRYWTSTRSRHRPSPRGPAWCGRPTARSPIRRRRRSASSRASRPMAAHTGGAHHPDRRRAPRRPVHSLRADAGHGGARQSDSAAGKNETEELPNCTQVVVGQRDAAPTRCRTTGVGARDKPRRCDGRTTRVRRLRRPRSRRIRRLGQPGHHEEGPAGTCPARADRRCPPRPPAPRHHSHDRHLRGAGHRGRALAGGPDPSTRSPSTAWSCA